MDMKTIIHSLLFAIMVIIDAMGAHAGVNLPQLKSKILNGKPLKAQGHRYSASLQLNDYHICSSAMFQTGFLITTSICAWFVGDGIQKKNQRATVVIGHSNLRKGRRVNILKVAYPSVHDIYGARCPKNDYSIGIVMVSNKVDYTRANILPLFTNALRLNVHNLEATVCGWGSVMNDNKNTNRIGNAEFSDILHCMAVHLRTDEYCRPIIRAGDYKRKLLCGEAKLPGQMPTLGDVGSPLIKTIKVNGVKMNYLVGVMLDRYDDENDMLLRFIRMHYAFREVEEILGVIETQITEEESRVNKSQHDMTEAQDKRIEP